MKKAVSIGHEWDPCVTLLLLMARNRRAVSMVAENSRLSRPGSLRSTARWVSP